MSSTPPPQKEISEADRDISDKQFKTTLSGIEIDTVLAVVGYATGEMVKKKKTPKDIDLSILSTACDKLTLPIEEDYKIRSRPTCNIMTCDKAKDDCLSHHSPQWTDDEVMKEIQDAFDRGVDAAESTIDMQKHDTAIRNATLDEILNLSPDTIQATENDGDLHAWNSQTIKSLRTSSTQEQP